MDSEKISQLLVQAERNAALVDKAADTLSSYTRSRLSWQSHAGQLEVIKQHVNDLAKNGSDLADIKAEGSEWQQEAIDRIIPLMNSMANHLTATIQHLNDNQSRIHMQPYRDYARGNVELSHKTLTLIRDYVDYDQARAKADALEKKLAGSQESSGE